MIDKNFARRVFSCIDNTTLNATDNARTVEAFCRRTKEMRLTDGTTVAAVCVYPMFVALAKRSLQGSGIKVASVAGAFPHGQLPLDLRVAEVRRVVDDGADEVDIVINRGLLLAGDYDEVSREVVQMKDACNGRTLKVILETGELSPLLIRRAAQRAIDAGADFIKTSTGKVDVNATPVAAWVMCEAIRRYYEVSGRKVGFKAAGGISTAKDALCYYCIVANILGRDWLCRERFRFGVSRLGNSLMSAIEQKTVSYF